MSGLYELLIPSSINQLKAMAAQLDKGVATSLEARLAPDMHPLAFQIKTACSQAADAVLRLSGKPLGVTPDVTDMASAKALTADTIADLEAVDAAAIDAAADKTIALDLPNGMAFDLSGFAYVRDWVLPQLHFHTSMAYAILRNQGVQIGKADLLPYMMVYFRKPAA